jgi:hypothetical protein
VHLSCWSDLGLVGSTRPWRQSGRAEAHTLNAETITVIANAAIVLRDVPAREAPVIVMVNTVGFRLLGVEDRVERWDFRHWTSPSVTHRVYAPVFRPEAWPTAVAIRLTGPACYIHELALSGIVAVAAKRLGPAGFSLAIRARVTQTHPTSGSN